MRDSLYFVEIVQAVLIFNYSFSARVVPFNDCSPAEDAQPLGLNSVCLGTE